MPVIGFRRRSLDTEPSGQKIWLLNQRNPKHSLQQIVKTAPNPNAPIVNGRHFLFHCRYVYPWTHVAMSIIDIESSVIISNTNYMTLTVVVCDFRTLIGPIVVESKVLIKSSRGFWTVCENRLFLSRDFYFCDSIDGWTVSSVWTLNESSVGICVWTRT